MKPLVKASGVKDMGQAMGDGVNVAGITHHIQSRPTDEPDLPPTMGGDLMPNPLDFDHRYQPGLGRWGLGGTGGGHQVTGSAAFSSHQDDSPVLTLTGNRT